jgi:hypothetical protein
MRDIMKLTIDLQKFVGPKFTVALFGGFCFLASMIFWRLPDLATHIDNVERNVRDDLKTTSSNIHDELTKMNSSVRDELNLTNLAVDDIRVTVVRLCVRTRQVDKDCNLKQIVAKVRTVAKAQAQFFDVGTVKFTGAQPLVVSNGLIHELPAVTSWAVQPGNSDKGQLASLIVWTNAADSTHWSREGKSFTAAFSNGTATFETKYPLSSEESKKLLDSLNDTAVTLHWSKQFLEKYPKAATPNDQK